MTITIGGKAYATRKPKNLDAILEERSGVNAAETARMVGGYVTPGLLAGALHPFLPEDAPSIPELAAAISEDAEAGPAIRALYANLDAPEPDEGKGK